MEFVGKDIKKSDETKEKIKTNEQHRIGNMAADGILISICAETNRRNSIELLC